MDFLFTFLLENKLYSLLTFALGFCLGFALAKATKAPTITALKSSCEEPKTLMHLGFVSVEKIYHNAKFKDVNCRFKNAKNICEESGKKCKFMR